MKKLLLSALALGIASLSYAQYCTSGATSTVDSRIDGVSITGATASFNNPTSNCTGYSDFTTITANGILTSTYNFSVTSGTCGSFQYTKSARAYMDWNQDGDFTDPGEDLGGFGGAATFVWNGTFTVPATAAVGTTRFRVVLVETSRPAFINPCGSYTWGETEDYSFQILPPGLFVSLNTPNNPLLCNGDSTYIAAAGLFGTPPYDFTWSSGQVTTNVINDTLMNIGAGTYTVTIEDAVGDDTTATLILGEPAAITVNAVVDNALVCDYDISEVSVSGSGGTSWGSYAWDTSMANYAWDSCQGVPVLFAFNNAISPNIPIGFTFEFYGQSYSQFKVGSNGFISFDPAAPTGCCDGDPIPNVSTFEPRNSIYAIWDYYTATFSQYSYCLAGTAPNRSLTVNFVDMPICCGTIPNASAQIIIYEGSNCIEIQTDYWTGTFGTQTQGIQNAAGTEATAYPGRNGVLWPVTQDDSYIQFCPADSNGLVYEWSNGYIGNNQTGLQPGTYTISATDANGCVVTTEVTINPAASNLASALDVDNVSCFGFGDASIDPVITGGIAPLSYSWNNGSTSASLSNLQPGTYSVSVEDNLGCTIEVNNIVVTQPDIMLGSVFNVQGNLCSNDSAGIASIAIAGGTAPYTPVWSNGEIGTTATGLGSGANFVEVTDSNGCQLYVPVNIPFQVNAPTPDLGNNILSANGASVQLNTAPTTYATYLWSTGETTPTIDVTSTGVYWVQVQNSSGCAGSDTVYIEIWPTGVEEMNALTGVTFYPNPARDMITFEINAEISELNVTVTDAKGAIVATKAFLNGGIATMDVANLPAGVYSMNLSSDKLVATQRLVISK